MRYFHTIYGAPGHPFKVDRTEWSEGPLRFRDRPPSTTSSTPPSTTSSVPRGVVDEALQKLQLAQRRIEELEKELQAAEACISEARIKIQRSDEATKVERWPAPGSEDTELGVFMEPEVSDGETEVYPRVQA